MKKFRFRLERVEKIKAKQQKQRAAELAKLMRERESRIVELKQLELQFSATQKEIFQRTVQGCPVNEIVECNRYMDNLKEEIREKKTALESLEFQIDELQSKLLQLDKEKKILAKLREKRHLEYMQKQTLEEQKFMDEISTLTKRLRQVL